MYLHEARNIRISMSCSSPRHVSSESPYHTPQRPCGNVRRICRGDPPRLGASLFSGWMRVLATLLRETKEDLPNHWLSDLFPTPAHIETSLILATIKGQRVSVWGDMLNHTYADVKPFPGSPRSLAPLRSLRVTSAQSEVATVYDNVPSHVPRCARGWVFVS